MRVLQVTGSSAGGVGRHVREIAALLAAGRPGEEPVQVLLAGPADVVSGVRSDTAAEGTGRVRAAVVDITDRPRAQDAAAIVRLRGLAAGADVVHAHGLRAGALAVLAARTLARRPRLVVTVHNLPVGGSKVQAVAAALEQVVARGADVVLGVSGDLVDRMRERGAREVERALVPAPLRTPATDPAAVRASLGVADGERLLVTVARLAPQKGLDLLLDAAAGLGDGTRGRHAAGPGLRWLLVGDGPLGPSLQQRIDAEGLPVVLAGRRDDVPDLFAAADVVVSTAQWEGQPLGIQEALAAGAAVVATDVGGTREVTGDAAVLVPYGEPGALVTAIREVLAHDDRAADLREAARRRAAELPTADDAVAQLRRVYAG